MKTILIVCRGNVFRSPVAEVVLNRQIMKLGFSQQIQCVSRGIQGQGGVATPRFARFTSFEEEYQLARSVLDRFDIDIDHHIATPLDPEIIEKADLIVALGHDVAFHKVEGLLTNRPYLAKKTVIREIADPYEQTGQNKYEIIVPQLVSVVENLTPIVIQLTKEGQVNFGKEGLL